jgi:hypothetical protein
MPPPKVVGRRGRGILQGNQEGFNVFEGKRRNDYKLFYDQLVLVGRQQIPVFFKTIRVIFIGILLMAGGETRGVSPWM